MAEATAHRCGGGWQWQESYSEQLGPLPLCLEIQNMRLFVGQRVLGRNRSCPQDERARPPGAPSSWEPVCCLPHRDHASRPAHCSPRVAPRGTEAVFLSGVGGARSLTGVSAAGAHPSLPWGDGARVRPRVQPPGAAQQVCPDGCGRMGPAPHEGPSHTVSPALCPVFSAGPLAEERSFSTQTSFSEWFRGVTTKVRHRSFSRPRMRTASPPSASPPEGTFAALDGPPDGAVLLYLV